MAEDAFLTVTPSLRLPLAELEFRATRAGGPGGQHVNTSSTRVEVVWDVTRSPALTETQRTRLLARLATRLDSAGRLRLVAATTRSQWRNREEAVARLREVVARALEVPKPRKRTKPSRAVKAARLEDKRRRSARKAERRRPAPRDD
jgi:ribosome-associated protein